MPKYLAIALLAGPLLADSASEALYQAARSGDLAKVEELLGQGVPANAQDSWGGTALHAAALAGNLQVAERLIGAGAQVDAAQWAKMGSTTFAPEFARMTSGTGHDGLVSLSSLAGQAPGGAGSMSDADIDARIAARIAARKAKNWGESDRIRDELDRAGVILEDKPGGTTNWRRA